MTDDDPADEFHDVTTPDPKDRDMSYREPPDDLQTWTGLVDASTRITVEAESLEDAIEKMRERAEDGDVDLNEPEVDTATVRPEGSPRGS